MTAAAADTMKTPFIPTDDMRPLLKYFLTYLIIVFLVIFVVRQVRHIIQHKFHVKIRGLGWFSIRGLEYEYRPKALQSLPKDEYPSFQITCEFLALRRRTPEVNSRRFFNIFVQELAIKLHPKSLAAYIQHAKIQKSRPRQRRSIYRLPEQGLNSSLFVVRWMAKHVSKLQLPIFVPAMANYVNLNITSVDCSIESVGTATVSNIMVSLSMDVDDKSSKPPRRVVYRFSRAKHIWQGDKHLTIGMDIQSITIKDSKRILEFPGNIVASSQLHLSPLCKSLRGIEVELSLGKFFLQADRLARALGKVLKHIKTEIIPYRQSSTSRSRPLPPPIPISHQLPRDVIISVTLSEARVECNGQDMVADDIVRGGLVLTARNLVFNARTDQQVASTPSSPNTSLDVSDFLSSPRQSPMPMTRSLPNSPLLSKSRKVQTFNTLLAQFLVDQIDLRAIHYDASDKRQAASFFALPSIELRASLSTSFDGSFLEKVTTRGSIGRIRFNYSLLTHYFLLLAVQRVKTSIPSLAGVASESGRAPKRVFDFETSIQFDGFHIFAELPAEIHTLFVIGVSTWNYARKTKHYVHLSSIKLLVKSPVDDDHWDGIVVIKQLGLTIIPAPIRPAGSIEARSGVLATILDLEADSIRMRIPWKYVLSNLIENIVNTMKSIKQLHHAYLAGEDDCIIEPVAEEAKRLPDIKIKSRVWSLEFDDDPFEVKLNRIWRVGMQEQRSRQLREEAFNAKAAAVEAERRQEAEEAEEQCTRPRTPSCSSSERPAYTSNDEQSQATPPPVTSRPPTRSRSSSVVLRERRRSTAPFFPKTTQSKLSTEEVYRKLQRYNSTAWIKRIQSAGQHLDEEEQQIRHELYGSPNIAWGDEDEMPVQVQHTPNHAPLLRVTFHGIQLNLSAPSFPYASLPDFMHNVGKGLPRDTQFSLLVPFHLKWKMAGAIIALRDYPVPLLQVPFMHSGQDANIPSWSLECDYVIGEELATAASVRRVPICILPENLCGNGQAFVIEVPRTISPVKMYSNIDLDINTANPTRFAWGVSMQPAIQDVIRVIDTMSRPNADPSEKVGFWDKIRLMLHWQLNIAWKGDGDVQLLLKGSRDPYLIRDRGTGFMKCWRGNVNLRVGYSNKDQEFLQVESDEYVLAVPDLSSYIDEEAEGNTMNNVSNVGMPPKRTESGVSLSQQSTESPQGSSTLYSVMHMQDAVFDKVAAKLTGGVRWGLGLAFERTCTNDCDKCKGNARTRKCRFFDFKPHYMVRTINPKYATKGRDSFQGFRSDFIHMSLSLVSPCTEGFRGVQPGVGYNTFHFTPLLFGHFFDWWALFDGSMSLPIRHGKMFPSMEAASKKFGRYLATVKYKFVLSPLFLSHIYRHESVDDWSQGKSTSIGLKAKVSSFKVDLHQREEDKIIRSKKNKTSKKKRGMAMNEAAVECEEFDLRAITADYDEPEKALFLNPESRTSSRVTFSQTSPVENVINESASEAEWIDLNDFVELRWVAPESMPKLRLFPILFCPKAKYYRQTDHPIDEKHAQIGRRSKFGKEDTHRCIIDNVKDVQMTQLQLFRDRLQTVRSEIAKNKKVLEKLQLKRAEATDEKEDQQLEAESDEIIKNSTLLFEREALIKTFIKQVLDVSNELDRKMENDDAHSRRSLTKEQEDTFGYDTDPRIPDILQTLWTENNPSFNNRAIIHNAQIFYNNSVRNVTWKYFFAQQKRFGMRYYMSSRAVQFIQELEKAKKMAEEEPDAEPLPYDARPDQDMIDMILNALDPGPDGHLPVALNEVTDKPLEDQNELKHGSDHMEVPDGFAAKNNFFVSLIHPQINLQSDVVPDSSFIVAATRMQFKSVALLDDRLLEDELNGLVKTRMSIKMDGGQFFFARKKDFDNDPNNVFTANHYGARDSDKWPAWVPMEAFIDYSGQIGQFQRVVQRTNAIAMYDKINALRLKNNMRDNMEGYLAPIGDEEIVEHVDKIAVYFPKFNATVNSEQYSTAYALTTDLLLYNDTKQKQHNDRVEELMSSANFGDLGDAAITVKELQDAIRQQDDIRRHYMGRYNSLDEEELSAFFKVRADYVELQNDLYLVMSAIAKSQSKWETKDEKAVKPSLRIQANADEFQWHMVMDDHNPLAAMGLYHASFAWESKRDNSVSNTLEVGRVQAINDLPSPMFIDLIAPLKLDSGRNKMLRIYWSESERQGKVRTIDHFEVNVIPLKLQLEHGFVKRLMEYVFPEQKQLEHKHKRPTNARAVSNEVVPKKGSKSAGPGEQMNYVYIKVPGVPLNLSYQADRQILNLYDLRFKAPTLEIRNETMSLAQFVDRVKTDVLLAATKQIPELLGQKMTQKRPAPQSAPLQYNASSESLHAVSEPKRPEHQATNGHVANGQIKKHSLRQVAEAVKATHLNVLGHASEEEAGRQAEVDRARLLFGSEYPLAKKLTV